MDKKERVLSDICLDKRKCPLWFADGDLMNKSHVVSNCNDNWNLVERLSVLLKSFGIKGFANSYRRAFGTGW